MKTKNIITVIVVNLLFTQGVVAQFKGWTKSKQQGTLIYVPNDLKSDETFKYTVYVPVALNGQNEKTWLLTNAKEQQNSLGKPLKPWKVTPEKNGGWGIANMYKNTQGQKMSVGYQSKTLSNGKVYMLQMITSNDIGIIMKYGKQIEKITKDAEGTFINNPSLASINSSPAKKQQTPTLKKKYPSQKKTKLTSKEKRLTIERAIRTIPGKGIKSSETVAIWVDSYINVLRGGIDVDTYILLKNGTAYKECKIPPNELLVSKSKELQPKKWTKWRKSGSDYQIYNKKKGIWKKLDGKRAIKSKAGERLNKKYITASGSQMTGSHKSWMTFKPNGTFELKNLSMMSSPNGSIGPSTSTVHKSDKTGTSGTTVVVGSDVGGGTSSKKKDGSKNTGTYFLNGYTITLKHDNGYEHTELFYFYKANKETFIYKDDRFWVDKK